MPQLETELLLQLSLEDEDGSSEICRLPLEGLFLGSRGVSFQAVMDEALRRCAEKRLEFIRGRLTAAVSPCVSVEVRSAQIKNIPGIH